MNGSGQKIAQNTAQLLYRAVKNASISPDELNTGDLIIITGTNNDVVGVVNNLQKINNQIQTTICTATGLCTIKISDKNYIHLIKRAGMLNLRDHTDYERGLKDMSKDTHEKERPEFGPVTDSSKSALPTSKISLNLKQIKQADQVTYVDEGRGSNWDDVIEDALGVKLDGQTPVYIARTDDPVVYMFGTTPIQKDHNYGPDDIGLIPPGTESLP